jgi:hypothetical protein
MAELAHPNNEVQPKWTCPSWGHVDIAVEDEEVVRGYEYVDLLLPWLYFPTITGGFKAEANLSH